MEPGELTSEFMNAEYQKCGLNKARGTYVLLKVFLIYESSIKKEFDAEILYGNLKPTAAEVELVIKRAAEIEPVYEEAMGKGYLITESRP